MTARSARTPRILYTSRAAGLGGGELRMVDHIRYSRFGPAAFRVIFLSPGELESSLRLLEVPYEIWDGPHLKSTGLTLPRTAMRVARCAPELMICNGYRDLLLAGPAAAVLGIPIIWRARADFVPTLGEKAWWRRRVFLRFLRNRVARTLCTTEYERRLILGYGVAAERVWTVYNGVDVPRFERARGARRAIREEFGVADDEPLVGFVARMVPQKGHLDFLGALARVTRDLPNVRALIVGDTTQLYGRPEYKATVMRRVDELALSKRVVFAGFREDIPAIMNAVDVFVSASTLEPFGTTTIEAMAAGKPVVATRTEGSMEIIDDGATGLLVPIGDPGALADALVSVLTRPDLASRLGTSAQVRARQRYDVVTNIGVFDDHCLSVLAETRGWRGRVRLAALAAGVTARPDADQGRRRLGLPKTTGERTR